MLTEEEEVEIHALRSRGWSIAEIARHTGFAYRSCEHVEGW